MPWSAKAQDLLKQQYAAVGSSARAALVNVVSALEQARDRFGPETSNEIEELLACIGTG